jgi:hypothetical protein
MPLGSPGSGGSQLLPAVVAGCVVNRGSGPRWVIAQMELPRTIERRYAFAQTFDGEHRRRCAGSRRWKNCGLNLRLRGDDGRDSNQSKHSQSCEQRSSRRHGLQSTLPASLLDRANFQRVLKVSLPSGRSPRRRRSPGTLAVPIRYAQAPVRYRSYLRTPRRGRLRAQYGRGCRVRIEVHPATGC